MAQIISFLEELRIRERDLTSNECKDLRIK